MANNRYVNKVKYGNQTLIDLTSDTVAREDVLSSKQFHLPTGESTTGSLVKSTYTIGSSALNFSQGDQTFNLAANNVTDQITIEFPDNLNPEDILYGKSVLGISGEFFLPYYSSVNSSSSSEIVIFKVIPLIIS